MNQKCSEFISLFIDEHLKKGLKGVRLHGQLGLPIQCPYLEKRSGSGRCIGSNYQRIPLHYGEGRFREILQRALGKATFERPFSFRRCRTGYVGQVEDGMWFPVHTEDGGNVQRYEVISRRHEGLHVENKCRFGRCKAVNYF